MSILIIILSILPIILIGIFYYQRDTIKEPIKLLRNLFFGGLLSGIIVMFISILTVIIFPSYKDYGNLSILDLLIYVFIFTSLIEELAKFVIVYISSKSKEYNQYYDIILYAVYVSLGFACFENLLYVLSNFNLFTALFRAITAIPAHASFQTLMGYYFTLSRLYPKKKKLYLSLSIIIPVIIHGLYDFLLYLNSPIFLIFFLVFVVILFVITILKTDEIINLDKSMLKK